jgi:hypothetical protein
MKNMDYAYSLFEDVTSNLTFSYNTLRKMEIKRWLDLDKMIQIHIYLQTDL